MRFLLEYRSRIKRCSLQPKPFLLISVKLNRSKGLRSFIGRYSLDCLWDYRLLYGLWIVCL